MLLMKRQMKNKELKTILKLANYVAIGMVILWILETLFFLIIEGWHLKATNPIEIFFDKVVLAMFRIAIFLYCYVGIGLITNLNSDEPKDQ